MLRFFSVIFFVLLFILADFAESEAQRRVTYQQLAMQNRTPGLYVDHNIIQSETENVWFNFRFGFDALNFRQQGSGEGERFEARAQVSIQIYELKGSRIPERLQNRLEDKNAIKTLNWSGSARASTYEQTSDARRFLNGNVSADLPPGRYAYQPRVTLDGRTIPMRSTVRTFTVPDFAEKQNMPVYFTKQSESDKLEYPLVNFGRSVLYAEDFSALFTIPDTEATYKVEVDQLNISERDTSRVRNVFSEDLDSSSFITASGIRMNIGERDEPRIRLLQDGDETLTFAYVTIPNRKFENSSFVIRLLRDGDIIATRHFRSIWIDIPTSLLNVDVAIRMMEVIVDRDTFRDLRRGNERERIRKFREFWSERDPEPETDYNPIMVEFYRRVDIAHERFTTPNIAGFETDQGKTYIRFGEPESVQRRFPSGGPAIEIWRYENQEFVFEATSGFGEYRLRERSSR